MTTSIADDYSYIKARMGEFAKEREQVLAPDDYGFAGKVEQYLGGEPAKEPAIQIYMGWDIYAPVNVNQANG